MSKQSEAVKRWRRNTKQKLILAMGGECCVCGYSKCDDALEFHHIDPNEKETHWGALRASIKSLKNIVEEMKKCVLLCSNCHKEVHSSTSPTTIPTNAPRLEEQAFWEIQEGIHDSVPKDNCPVCGELKPSWYMTCSLRCGYIRSSTKIDWKKYDILELYQTLSVNEIANKIGCSSGAVSGQLKKLDPTREIRNKINKQTPKDISKARTVSVLKKKAIKSLAGISDQEILSLYEREQNYEKVGRVFNVTGAAIKRRLKKINSQRAL